MTVLATISHVNSFDIRGILQAAFLGEKKTLTHHTKSTFRDAGIYHLLAISGLHVAILISSIWLALLKIPVSRTLKILITVLFIWSYLFFIGLIPSLFRAVLMATLILLSFIFQRNSHVLNSLGFAGIVWLIISPLSLFTPGFQLSFAATFGIITLYPVFSNIFMPSLGNPAKQFLIKIPLTSFYVSLSGFIATAPVLMYHFGSISPFGLLANIFAVVLMGCAMNSFFIAIVMQLIWEPVSVIFMGFTEFLLNMLSQIAEFSRLIAFSSIEVPVVYLEFFWAYIIFFIGLILVNRKYRISYLYWAFPTLILLVPAIILIHSLSNHTEITFFSCQDGSITGVKFSNNNIWLIGSAPHTSQSKPFRNAIGPWLRHCTTKNFDAILLPSLPQNIIHDLDPIFNKYKPNSIIGSREPNNERLKEDFTSYLNNNRIDYVQAQNNWLFIPSLNCTCVTYIEKCKNRWYDKCDAAITDLSIGNVKIRLNDNDNYSVTHNNTFDLLKTSDSVFIKSAKFHEKTGDNKNTTFKAYSLQSHGAITVIINRSGIRRINAMLENY